MRMRAHGVGVCLLFLLAFGSVCVLGPARGRADPGKEEGGRVYSLKEGDLSYEFEWNGIAAAQAKASIKRKMHEGAECYHVVVDIRTKPFIDWLWKLRDRLEGYIEAKTFKPLRYSFRQREGSYRHDTDIIFDHKRNTATSIRTYKGKIKKKTVDAENMLDPVSALFYLLIRPLEPGQSRILSVFDGKRVHTIKYEALGREGVKVPVGKINALKVVPSFLRSDPPRKPVKGGGEKVREVFLWVSQDRHRDIVKIESDVFVGKINAKLIGR